MLHSFCFKYHGEDIYLCFDSLSLALFRLDKSGYLVLKNKYESLDSDESEAFLRIPEAEVAEIEKEWQEVIAEDGLGEEYNLPFRKSGIIKALCLNICHDCNLACKYCFAKEGTYNTPRDYMSLEVGKKAIDFLIKMSGPIKNIEADFFGGEPLLNLDVVKQVVEYANQEVKKHGKTISFTLTTNCVTLDKPTIDYLNETMDNVVLSIDGRKEIHDAVRVGRKGSASYDRVVANSKAFRAVRGDKKYYVRGTFTRYNLDFTEDFKALNDLGFDQISLEPVVLDEGNPLSIRKEDIPRVLEEYDSLTTEYIDRRLNGQYSNFFHFMLDIEQSPCIEKRLSGCGAGCSYVAIAPSGDIYPCHQFVGNSEYSLGNVLEGTFDDSKREFYRDITVIGKKDCSQCFAKYYCGGGCMANAKFYAGDFHSTFESACAMMRKRLECSLAVIAIEKEKKVTEKY